MVGWLVILVGWLLFWLGFLVAVWVDCLAILVGWLVPVLVDWFLSFDLGGGLGSVILQGF